MTVKERPILMSAPMVLATIEDSKTQTRRIIKPQPTQLPGQGSGIWHHVKGGKWESGLPYRCKYGKRGERLWVKETFQVIPNTGSHDWDSNRIYRADMLVKAGKFRAAYVDELKNLGKWKPSIFMSRWASRITLEIEKVRVQRLQDISEEDCIAEGIRYVPQLGIMRACGWADYSGRTVGFLSAKDSYRTLWESINRAGSWDANPWVWAISFKRDIECA